jgi:hypothetical protein
MTATSLDLLWMFPPWDWDDTGMVLSPISSEADTVTVAGESLTPSSGVAPGTSDVPMLKLTLSTNANDAEWSAVTVDNRCVSHTPDAADIELVKVYRDNNSNGTFEATEDVCIGSSTVIGADGGSGTVTFAAETITITPSIYFIAYDIDSDADPSHYCGAELTDNSYITVAGDDVVAEENFPIQTTQDQTLPVELAAFTATYVDNYTAKICWTTASETDVIGFNIYRNTENVFGTSVRVNDELIPGHGTTSSLHEYEFIDRNPVEFGTTYYWLESVEHGPNRVYGSIKYVPEEGPGGFVNAFDENILGNYPNPFSGSTTIEYGIKGRLKAEPVEIRIYNITGQMVETIEARDGRAVWDASGYSNGIYFYELVSENFSRVNKMLLIR